MKYKKGTLVFAERTVFADNGRYDNRFGHPAMIPIAVDDFCNEIYYLLLTSNIGRVNLYPDQYYDLSDCWEEAGLQKPSLINLQHIYKGSGNMRTIGGLWPRLFKDVIKKLKEYQNMNPSKYYEEIRNLI